MTGLSDDLVDQQTRNKQSSITEKNVMPIEGKLFPPQHSSNYKTKIAHFNAKIKEKTKK